MHKVYTYLIFFLNRIASMMCSTQVRQIVAFIRAKINPRAGNLSLLRTRSTQWLAICLCLEQDQPKGIHTGNMSGQHKINPRAGNLSLLRTRSTQGHPYWQSVSGQNKTNPRASILAICLCLGEDQPNGIHIYNLSLLRIRSTQGHPYW